MFNQLKISKFSQLIFLLLGLFFLSCKTTNSLVKEAFEPDAPQEASYLIASELEFPVLEDNYKYIFFRLYNPIYKNPFYIANMLKGGISITLTDKVPDVSHASINFSLDDSFYGLTLGGKYQLAKEECSDPLKNKYMKNCNPKKSEQITYALKVKEEEYENAKKFVQFYIESTDIKYASGLNFKIAAFDIKKKFFTSKEHKKFGTIIYPKSAKNQIVNLEEDKKIKNDFVCSTFIGYVLYNNVESITCYFDENNIKYDYLNVSDICLIPGITPLFYSTWENYLIAAQAFIEEYPEFKEYLSN